MMRAHFLFFAHPMRAFISRFLVSAIIAPLVLLAVAGCAKKDAGGVALFNGKDLTGWVAFAKDAPAGGAKTWGVANGVITCTGEPFGYIRTEKTYGDYHLVVEWRWPAAARPNAQGRIIPRNSGVFVHMKGEDKVWPACLEAQLQEQNAGDFIAFAGFDTNEHRGVTANAMGIRRLPKKNASSEKPDGEWNRYDIVCAGDTVTVSVNGVEQNRVTGARAREGHICLQSEGAPVEFRNVALKPVK